MIKKFNESWHSYDDDEKFTLHKGEKLESALRRAKSFAIKKDRVIAFQYEKEVFRVDKYTNVDNILKKQNNKENDTPKFKIGDEVIIKSGTLKGNYGKIDKIYGKKYDIGAIRGIDEDSLEIYKPIKSLENEQKYKIGDIVYVKVSRRQNLPGHISKLKHFRVIEYDPTRTNNYKLTSHNNFDIWVPEDWLTTDRIEKPQFEKGFEVIGLPSGQVIYMNDKQVQWFKARKVIAFVKIWKKPIVGGHRPIELNKWCFEDPNYKKIIDMLDTISW